MARSSQKGEVGDQNATFKANNLPSSSCQFDQNATKQLYLPRWSAPCFTDAYNQANFNLTDLNITKGMSAQLNLQATAAMAKRYHLGSRLATFEFGRKFRNEHKFDNEYFPDYAPNTTTRRLLVRSRVSFRTAITTTEEPTSSGRTRPSVTSLPS